MRQGGLSGGWSRLFNEVVDYVLLVDCRIKMHSSITLAIFVFVATIPHNIQR